MTVQLVSSLAFRTFLLRLSKTVLPEEIQSKLFPEYLQQIQEILEVLEDLASLCLPKIKHREE